MSTVLDVAFWVLPAALVTVLIVRNEHRIRTSRKQTNHDR